MTRRRDFLLGLGALATAGALTGCGAGSRTGANTAAKVDCDVPDPDSPTTVNVLAYNSSAVDPFTNTMVASCTKGNLSVRHDPIDFAGQVQKTEATLGGDNGTYDIIETYGFVLPTFAADGKLKPLDEYFDAAADKYALGEINEDMRERMSYEGKLYALPMQAQVLLLAYRSDVFDELGLEPPTTFAELREVAEKIQQAGEIRFPLALPWLASSDIATAYVAALGSLGQQYVDPDTNEPQFDSEEAATAFEELKSLLPYMDPQVTTFDQPKVQQQMYNGTAAMSVMFSGRMNDLTNKENSQYADVIQFAAPPAVKEGGKQYGAVSIDGWSIPHNAKADPALLFEVMAASVSEDASRASVPAAYPARNGMISNETARYADAAVEAIANAPEPQPYPYVALISNDTISLVTQVITGKKSVTDGLAEMQSMAQQILGQQ